MHSPICHGVRGDKWDSFTGKDPWLQEGRHTAPPLEYHEASCVVAVPGQCHHSLRQVHFILHILQCVEEVPWSCGGLETHDRPLRDMPEEQCLYYPLHKPERGGEIAGTCTCTCTCIHNNDIMTH